MSASPQSPTECLIAFGGNLGDVRATFERTLAAMTAGGIEVVSHGTLLVSPPMGDAAGGEFLNTVIRVRSPWSATETLNQLHAIEDTLGRVRRIHWGPRTVDLDLLLHGDTVLSERKVQVPHPAMWARRFVMQPAAEAAPEMRHPVFGQTMSSLFERMQERPLQVAVSSDSRADSLPLSLPMLAERLEAALPKDCVRVVYAPDPVKPHPDATRKPDTSPFAELSLTSIEERGPFRIVAVPGQFKMKVETCKSDSALVERCMAAVSAAL